MAITAVFAADALIGVPVCIIVLANVAVSVSLLEFGVLCRGCGANLYRKTALAAGIAILNWPWLSASVFEKFSAAAPGAPGLVPGWCDAGIVLMGVAFAVLVVHMRERQRRATAFADAAATLMGLIYLAVPIAVFLPIAARQGPEAWKLVLWLLASAKIGDMAACTLGSLIGRHKLAPATSPNKTIEGAAASLLASLAASLLIGVLLAGVAWHVALAVGAVVSVAAQFGDLLESALKRSADMKDSASFMPAFGGMLDLLDSLVFSMPAGAIAAQWLGGL